MPPLAFTVDKARAVAHLKARGEMEIVVAQLAQPGIVVMPIGGGGLRCVVNVALDFLLERIELWWNIFILFKFTYDGNLILSRKPRHDVQRYSAVVAGNTAARGVQIRFFDCVFAAPILRGVF